MPGGKNEAVKRIAKKLGLYKKIRGLKGAAYILPRDNPAIIKIGINHLLKDFPRNSVIQFQKEFHDSGILDRIESGLRSAAMPGSDKGATPGSSSPLNLQALYILCRCLKPRVAVETGVASGSSSLTLLTAMQKNEEGALYSIDLPPEAWAQERIDYRDIDRVTLPSGRAPGWLVPQELKSRWNLLLGDARKEFPNLLGRLNAIDLFYHDAEHTYEAMISEFRLAWRHLNPGGVLTSDDVGWNDSFADFGKESGTQGHAKQWFSFGFLRKQ